MLHFKLDTLRDEKGKARIAAALSYALLAKVTKQTPIKIQSYIH